MYTVIAKLKIPAEKQDEFKRIGAELVAKSKMEEAVISYSLNNSPNETGLFAIVEIYTDKNGHEFHKNTPHVMTLFPQLEAMASEKAVIEFYSEI